MKKSIKILLAAFVVFGISISSMAAQVLQNKNAIGVYVLASENTIGGIQYERRVNDLLSLKFDTFIYYSSRGYGTALNYNVCCEADFTLFSSEWNPKAGSRLFAYALAGHQGILEQTSKYDETVKRQVVTGKEFYPDAIVSAGFGFEFIFISHLSLEVQFGFQGTFPYGTTAGFCGGTGLRYSF